jgi:hypothetical protein
VYFRYDPDAWRPELPGPPSRQQASTSKLEPGALVVFQRKAYRVVEVRERAHANWPDAYRDAWVQQGMPDPDTWYCRPRVIVLRSEDDPTTKALNLQVRNDHYWHTLPEHYPICRLCKEIPPCVHVHNERIMDRATEKMAEDMAILPGSCHACKEPITRRQKSFTFPGPNLIRPDLGDGSAVFHTRRQCFHTRRQCFDAIKTYDRRWAQAEESRTQFFYCEGTFTVHHDDSSECTYADCRAKGPLADCVEHKMWVRHHPRMREAKGCWCLAGVLF